MSAAVEELGMSFSSSPSLPPTHTHSLTLAPALTRSYTYAPLTHVR